MRELGDVGRPLAPARLGPAAQRPETRARRVEQDAVEPAHCTERRGVDLATVEFVHHDVERHTGDRVAHELGACGHDLVGGEHRAAGERLGREDRGLATWAGAEVEPPLARHDRASPGQRERGELRALVLHAHPAAAIPRRARADDPP